MIKASKEFRPTIVVMAKSPQAGTVKTRLRPVLTETQSAALAGCFFQDTIRNACSIAENIIVAFANGREILADLSPEKNLIWIEQRGADLGAKLEAAIRDAENLGFNPTITIGADSPTLPPEFLRTAIDFFQNEHADAVLGGTDDGGFYLIGLSKIAPRLFENIAWSTSAVYRQTSANLQKHGFSNLLELPVWYDVDTPEDLRRLHDDIFTDADLQCRAPATFGWLSANGKI